MDTPTLVGFGDAQSAGPVEGKSCGGLRREQTLWKTLKPSSIATAGLAHAWQGMRRSRHVAAPTAGRHSTDDRERCDDGGSCCRNVRARRRWRWNCRRPSVGRGDLGRGRYRILDLRLMPPVRSRHRARTATEREVGVRTSTPPPAPSTRLRHPVPDGPDALLRFRELAARRLGVAAPLPSVLAVLAALLSLPADRPVALLHPRIVPILDLAMTELRVRAVGTSTRRSSACPDASAGTAGHAAIPARSSSGCWPPSTAAGASAGPCRLDGPRCMAPPSSPPSAGPAPGRIVSCLSRHSSSPPHAPLRRRVPDPAVEPDTALRVFRGAAGRRSILSRDLVALTRLRFAGRSAPRPSSVRRIVGGVGLSRWPGWPRLPSAGDVAERKRFLTGVGGPSSKASASVGPCSNHPSDPVTLTPFDHFGSPPSSRSASAGHQLPCST